MTSVETETQKCLLLGLRNFIRSQVRMKRGGVSKHGNFSPQHEKQGKWRWTDWHVPQILIDVGQYGKIFAIHGEKSFSKQQKRYRQIQIQFFFESSGAEKITKTEFKWYVYPVERCTAKVKQEKCSCKARQKPTKINYHRHILVETEKGKA